MRGEAIRGRAGRSAWWRWRGEGVAWTLAAALACTSLAPLVVGCDANRASSLTLMNEGVTAYNEGNYGGAAAKLKLAIETWPENAEANYLLGQIYLWKFDQPDQAVANLQKATELDATRPDYWYQLGYAQQKLQRLDEAQASLGKAVELNDKHASALLRLGMLAEQKGELVKAAELYGRSVQAGPRKPEAYNYLGDLYFRNEKYDEAQQVFKNGVDNVPQSAELHNGLGNTYLALDRKKEAVVEYQEALRLKSPYPSALYNLGMTYFALGDKGRAKTYLEKFNQAATGGDNSARIAAAQARLMEIKEEEEKAP